MNRILREVLCRWVRGEEEERTRVYHNLTRERSGHVCGRDEEIGELVIDVTSEPIEDKGTLGEDGGGIPGGCHTCFFFDPYRFETEDQIITNGHDYHL